jgi:hypothetical protein
MPLSQTAPQSLLLVERQGLDIAGAVHDADDNDFGIGKAVIQRVVTVKVHAQPFSETIPARADLGLG